MKREITTQTSLLEGQRLLLDMHSFLNIINILNAEIHLLRHMIRNDAAFEGCVHIIGNIRNSFGDDSPSLITSHQMQEFHTYVEQEIAKECYNGSFKSAEKQEIEKSIDNIRSLFRIIHIRVREMNDHNGESESWIHHKVDVLKQKMTGFLNAIAKNSRGRFGIVFDPESKGPNDYLVDLQIKSVDGEYIIMPIVFFDSFRDLVANARKYTPHGGTIHARLEDNGDDIIIEVSDNGVGIPENEIDSVVKFGYRASNVINKETMGGGFGLSKAYYVTKKMNGRMWVDSKVKKGTTVTIQIPRGYQD